MTPLTLKTFKTLAVGGLLVSSMAAYAEPKAYNIDVWADNWFSAYINGQPLFEDSVSITTERSFNAESHKFSAEAPFVLSFVIKDFKENDTGLEYIGSDRQQMGDGGFIAQITDMDTDKAIAVSDAASMRCKVIHKAPLDTSCADSSKPVAGEGACQFESEAEPEGWKAADFDDSSWSSAIEYSAAQVQPKQGYDKILWDSAAKLVWTGDLEKDNTILCRMTVSAESAKASASSPSHMHEHFKHFNNVKTREDSRYFVVASNGLPNHNMMVGITNWQQQVALPQDYTGNNSWKIPLKPEMADKPMYTKDHFHKGAIAIAVNGVPIFNALNNRGEYAADIGELDQWGGHSGRADDYHYHVAPEHLEKVVGKDSPIAYALDGFPLYGQTQEPLDEYLGRFNKDGSYQYHAVDYPPYLITAFKGKVEVDSLDNAPEDQIEPQPKSSPVRTADYGPLRGAKITGLTKVSETSYELVYTLNDKEHQIHYSWDANGQYKFVFIDADGNKTVENYDKNRRGGKRPPRGGKKPREDGQRGGGKPPADGQQPRKYCGDGLCDNTESSAQCPADCAG